MQAGIQHEKTALLSLGGFLIGWKTGLLACYSSLMSPEKGEPAEPLECYPGLIILEVI
jgi:hypothetical protein